MDPVEKYFWLIAGAFAMLNVVVWRRRLTPMVAAGRVSKDEADAFIRGAALSIAIGASIFGLIDAVFGVGLGCVRPFAFSDPASAATSAAVLCAWVALLRWVWGRGGELIARAPSVFVQPLSADAEYDPFTVRVVATALVLVSGIGAFVVGGSMPPSSGCGG